MDLEAFKRLKGTVIAIVAEPDASARDLYAAASRARLPAEHDGVTVAIKNPDTGERVGEVKFERPMVVRELTTDVKAALKAFKQRKG